MDFGNISRGGKGDDGTTLRLSGGGIEGEFNVCDTGVNGGRVSVWLTELLQIGVRKPPWEVSRCEGRHDGARGRRQRGRGRGEGGRKRCAKGRRAVVK